MQLKRNVGNENAVDDYINARAQRNNLRIEWNSSKI